MASLVEIEKIKPYYKAIFGEMHVWEANLAKTTWVYVGNLSFYTTESQIHALFSTIDVVRRVVLGRNKFTHAQCGFAFVE